MSNCIDIKAGDRFGKLVILEEVKIKKDRRHFICKCDCGKTSHPIQLYQLTKGRTISCGCVMRSNGGKNFKKFNVYKKLENDVGECYSPDGKNFLFIFDWIDKKFIDNYCWYIRSDGYALANDLSGKNKKVRFHRFVLSKRNNIPISDLDNVDHINGNTRDNRVSNLRNVSSSENKRNKISHSKNIGRIMGVRKNKNSYIARIVCDHKQYSKSFGDEYSAIRYRLFMELLLFGEEFSPQRYLFEKYKIDTENKDVCSI